MPKRSVQQRTGHRGEAFVDKALSDGGHVRNDTRRDFAVDGQIEFVGADREVTGVAVVTQVKATEVGFQGENATEFKCNQVSVMMTSDHSRIHDLAGVAGGFFVRGPKVATVTTPSPVA
ncbi:DUF4365 domain-containing protein [Streptomyces flaveus]|uniref:DUF4365 domain-containing protein n=1 Tax=Streptomyces flaveus TaxID=66370 RepID=UPI0033182B31